MRLHCLALEKLRLQPELKVKVLALLERWLEGDAQESSRPSLEEWRSLLQQGSLEELARVVLDEQRGQTLRQCSPLAPVLTPQERWGALKQVNAELRQAATGWVADTATDAT